MVAKIAKRVAWLLPLCSVALATDQTATPKPIFWARATIKQTDSRVSVRANYPRPLDQALEAVRQKYGWVVDYEEPPYGPPDLVDDTDPVWRKAHPSEKGVTRVAGGMFRTDFSQGTDMSAGSPDEERVLNQIVADYQASGNPGEFVIRKEIASRYAVVGVGARDSNGNRKEFNPVLDTRIALPVEEHTLSDELVLIARLLSEKSGYKVDLGEAPLNLVFQTKVKIGAEERPARELLADLSSAARFRMAWRLLYDADWGGYFLNLDIAMVATSEGPGPPQLKPIPSAKPGSASPVAPR